jgi:UDP-N-acetylglucosamine 2-epimerase (non-hydrolysing)
VNGGKLILVAGARPNFMKLAPIVWELRKKNDQQISQIEYKIVHTEQHYDYEMSRVFFEELDIPEPDYAFGAGSGNHAEQTAKIMVEFDRVCSIEKPDMVVVFGDVNSTLACSVTAKKLSIKVAHVEAGLRSRDMGMPEEINRIVTDSISDYLFVTEKSGVVNLRKEGRDEPSIFFVGNIMIDTLYCQLEKLKNAAHSGGYNAIQKPDFPYAIVTLHRPSNVDNKITLQDIIEALVTISQDMPIIFPAHPRTIKNIKRFGLYDIMHGYDIKMTAPLPYLDFLRLWRDADLVFTDSGGLQEETTVLNVPCFTIRENTERPVTIEEGTNTLVGTSKTRILSAYQKFKNEGGKKGRVPELWDGKAAQRIVTAMLSPSIK